MGRLFFVWAFLLVLVTVSGQNSEELPIKGGHGKLERTLKNPNIEDSIKVKTIYSWITQKIRYDYRALKKVKREFVTTRQTLRKRKGICYQYSDLFNYFCKIAEIESHEITGYSKGSSHFQEDLFYETDHSWNGVQIGQNWYLIDCTWGSGFLEQRPQRFKKFVFGLFNRPFIRNKYRFVHLPNDKYLLVPPQEMTDHHLPGDPNWQLTEVPISLDYFQGTHVSFTDSVDFSSNLAKYVNSTMNSYVSMNRKRTFEFNRENHIANAEHLQLEGYSLLGFLNEKSTSTDINQVSDYYRRSTVAANAHIRTARLKNKVSLDSVNRRMRKHVQKPVSSLKSKLAGLISSISDFKKQERSIAKLSESHFKMRGIDPSGFKDLDTKNYSQQTDSSLVAKNREILSSDSVKIKIHMDSCKGLLLRSQKIDSNINDLKDYLIILTSDLIASNAALTFQLTNNAEVSGIIDVASLLDFSRTHLNQVLNSLRQQRKERTILISNFYQLTGQLNSDIRKSLSLIEKNCIKSSGELCDSIEYRSHQSKLKEIHEFKSVLLGKRLDFAEKSLDFSKRITKECFYLSKQTEKTQKLIGLYLKLKSRHYESRTEKSINISKQLINANRIELDRISALKR